MQVILCTTDYRTICPKIANLRYAFADVVIATWEQMGHNVCVIHSDGKDSQRERRIRADEMADSDIYIITGDDLFPEYGFDVNYGVSVLRTHPEFAFLGAWPCNETIHRWTPEEYEPIEDDEVMEHISVGSIGFTRKGVMGEWPPMGESRGYDRIHADHLRSMGLRVGYLRKLSGFHLGKGYSSVWL